MHNYQAISRERHSDKRWERFTNYTFAAADTVVPLTSIELPKAAMSFPISFIAQGDGYVPAAILGLLPGNNLFVTPDWRWIAQYIPAYYRASPFRLLKAEDGQQILCIDENIGLAADKTSGESFFDEAGKPTQAIQDILNFLNQIEQSRLATTSVCSALQKHNLIRPWQVTLKTDSGEQQIAGLFQIDEMAMNQLSGEALLEVRQAGGLPVAYCQLLSMQHLPMLSQLYETQLNARKKTAQQSALNEELKTSFFNNNGTISFAGLIS